MKFTLLAVLIIFNFHGYSQPALDTAAVKSELNAIFERDQKIRKGDSVEFGSYIDSCNLAQVENLISKFGWMGKSVIGVRGNYTLWLVIQHADLATQEKYLPMIEKSVELGESRVIDLAYLRDRVLMRQGKKQIYGTQVVPDKYGGQNFHPIEDEANVNVRRAEVGMEPIEEYARYFGIDYKLPEK